MINPSFVLLLLLLLLAWFSLRPPSSFSWKFKGGKGRRTFLHKFAAALGTLLLLGMAWTTWRDKGTSLPPAPRVEIHAPHRLLHPAASGPAALKPGETGAFLFQAFLGVLLEDGFHPVSCREKKVSPPLVGKRGKYTLFVPFEFPLGKNRIYLLAKLSDPVSSRGGAQGEGVPHGGRDSKAGKSIDVTWSFGWNRPQYGSVAITTRLEGEPSFYWSDLGWRRRISSLGMAFSLHPDPPLPYVFLTVLLPLRKDEKLLPVRGESLKEYFQTLRALDTEGIYSTETSVKACFWEMVPSSLPASSRPQRTGPKPPPPGFPALTDTLPSSILLLFALGLVSQAFPRRYPAFLLLVVLSMAALAGLDRARLHRNLGLLQDSKAPLSARLLAAHQVPGTYFFKKTAVQKTKGLARDPNLPPPLRRALSSLFPPKSGQKGH